MSLVNAVSQTAMADDYVNHLLAGDRAAARALVDRALLAGTTPRGLLNDLVWPTMERIQALYREDRIELASLNLATRLNRSIAERLAERLERSEPNGRKVLIICGDDEPEELGGQIATDLFEADGWCVKFAGGGVPNDETLRLLGEFRPDLLLMFATLPTGVPAVRKLIDYLRDVNSCPNLQVMCAGGIYKRAEGLAEEIGADLYAPDAESAVQTATRERTRKATVDQQTVGRTRRLRKAAARRVEAIAVASADSSARVDSLDAA